MHPWQSERIEEEKKPQERVRAEEHREIWKMKTILRNFYTQVKKSIAATGSKLKQTCCWQGWQSSGSLSRRQSLTMCLA